jgi:hypothetical protein
VTSYFACVLFIVGFPQVFYAMPSYASGDPDRTERICMRLGGLLIAAAALCVCAGFWLR